MTVAVRVAYWLLAAFSLLWAPSPGRPGGDLLVHTFDRWDSVWFSRIATVGYDRPASAAFFPVYPLLVHGLAFVVRSHVLAGVLLSLAAAGAASVLLGRIARRHLPADAASTTVVLFALYPLAFVFTAVYSDALFTLFVVAAFEAAERGHALVAGVAAGLAVDTRALGLALVPALAVVFWPSVRRLAPLLLVPAALGLWMLYLHEHYGDGLAFAHAEQEYWHRATPSPHAYWHALRQSEAAYSNLLFHGYVPLAAATAADVACLVAAVWLTGLTWRRLGPALAVFSWATIVLAVAAPARREPFFSLPRFLLADFPLFLVLASLLVGRPRAREIVYAGFAAVGAVAAVGFAHGVGVA